jgi:hypothetical protein
MSSEFPRHSNESAGWVTAFPSSDPPESRGLHPSALDLHPLPQHHIPGRAHTGQAVYLPAHPPPLPAATVWGNGRGRDGGRERRTGRGQNQQ